MGTNWQRASFEVPKSLSKDERLQLAEDIVDMIRRNAEAGVGIPFGVQGLAKSKVKFKGYSKAYENSLDFKVAGKNKGQTPDLTLSGDMLASIEVLSESKGKVVVGFEKGSEENGKADGNCRGTYGTNKPSEKKARNFMGLSEADFNKLVRQYDGE